jgi:hypothetical protein
MVANAGPTQDEFPPFQVATVGGLDLELHDWLRRLMPIRPPD